MERALFLTNGNYAFSGGRDQGARTDRLGQQGNSAAHGEDELHGGEGGPPRGARGKICSSYHVVWLDDTDTLVPPPMFFCVQIVLLCFVLSFVLS